MSVESPSELRLIRAPRGWRRVRGLVVRIGAFALVELLVCRSWRRGGIATRLHDTLIEGRPEQRATLTVLPEAEPAYSAYRAWGWRRVAQKSNPLLSAPTFDVMIKPLQA